MIVPHSQRKVVNLQFSWFGLLFVGVLLATLVAVSVTLSTGFTRTHERFLDASRALAASETTVESMADEVKELQRVVIEFRQSLERVLGVVGTENARGYLTGGVGGDLASFVSESLVIASDVRSLTELRSLRTYLEAAIGPLQEIENALLAQRELLVDIPSLWPVAAGKGYITTEFGPAIHPFNRRWYIHKGIDIAWLRGTEIVATADGRVQRVGYEPYNLGHFVIVKHKYGFATVYGHLKPAAGGEGGAAGRARRGARLPRQHRALHRPPRTLRSVDRRAGGQPAPVSVDRQQLTKRRRAALTQPRCATRRPVPQ